MSSQTKSEKQLVDAKIAKVREVVRNVSNNDIVLALHNFDMDVNRTIQALTADIDSALGEWTKKGSTDKKSKQKKKNKNNAVVVDGANSSAATSITTETPKLSSISSRPSTNANLPPQRSVASVNSQLDAKHIDSKTLSSSTKTLEQLSDEQKLVELESLLHELDIKSAQIQKGIDNAYSEQSVVISAIQTALNNRERQLIAHLESSRQQVEAKVQQQRAAIQKLKQNSKVAADEFARLKAEHASLDSLLKANFTVHGDKAIKAVEKLGSGFLSVAAEAVSYSSPVVYPVNGTLQSKIAHQVPPAQAPPAQAPQQNGKSAYQLKQQNGTNFKHSVSHSSLASEENDSGLGQISPVSQEKSVAQVADGGFLFASDGLNADQLAKLKAQVTETLKAQGIDPNILASIASSDTAAASRRRNQLRKDNPKSTNKDNNKKSTGNKTIKS